MPRARCPKCGRVAAAYVPAGGDGSGYLIRAHKDPEGNRCKPYRLILDVDDLEED